MSSETAIMIDFEMGKMYLGRDHDSFLKRFIEVDLQVYISKLQNIYNRNDYKELSRCCESLYNTSAYVGAKTCQVISSNIVDNIRANNDPGIAAEISNLIDHSDKLEVFLKDYFNTVSSVSSGENLDKIGNSVDETVYDSPSFRLKVPAKDIPDLQLQEKDDDFDPYEAINKDWKCVII